MAAGICCDTGITDGRWCMLLHRYKTITDGRWYICCDTGITDGRWYML